MSDRFSPSIKIDHARKFIEVESLRQQGRVAEAWAKFQEYGVDMANMGGAMNLSLQSLQGPPDPSSVIIRDMEWLVFRRVEIPQFSNEVYAFKFTIPEGPPLPVGGYCSVFEYRGQPSLRHATLSKYPGDFRAIDPTGINGPYNSSGGMQASIFWTRNHDAALSLQPGTYYFNIKNINQDTNSPAMVETNWPHP